ncbi:MAG: O-antigen ligase family protein [Solirubrobacteraceae bacterium]
MACWLLGVIILAPALTAPTIALGLCAGVVTLWLAQKSVAYPLALSGVPSLVTAINGTNPLPQGAATVLTAGWIALGVVIVLYRRQQGPALRALMSFPCAMAALLFGLMLWRVSGSLDPTYGTKKTEQYLLDNLMLMLGGVFVGVDRKSVRLFLVVTLGVVVTSSLLLVMQLLTGSALQSYGAGTGRFTISAQAGAISLGRTSADGALIAIGVILIARRTWQRFAALAVVPLTLLAMLSAGSRGPTVAFVIGLLVMIVLSATTGRAQKQLLLVGAVLVAAGFLLPLVVPGSAISRALSAILGTGHGLSSNGRSTLWNLALNAFSSHIWLGIGTGGYAALATLPYPHDVFLEMAAELGVIGLIVVSLLLWSMAARLRASWRAADPADRLVVALVTALFTSAFLNALVSGQVADNAEVWLWGGVAVGMSVAAKSPVKAVAAQRLVHRGRRLRQLGA